MTRRAWALAAVLVLAAVPAAPAQPERSEFLEGTHAFRRILYDGARKKLTPLRDVGELTDPRSTLIVVLGDPSPLKALNKKPGLRSFVHDGGALLVATDHQTPPELNDSFGVHVDGDFLTLPGGAGAYRSKPECPYIDPRPGADVPLFDAGLPSPRPEQAKRIASNKPSYLRVAPVRLPILASLPERCSNGRGHSHGPWYFDVGDNVGDGRLLVMADQDVFINEMMLQPDNGNIDFAYRCADWLLARTDGKRGRRDKVLYYEDGAVQTMFDIPLKDLPPPPIPPPDTLMGMLDEMARGMEQEGFFAQFEEDDVVNHTVDDLMGWLPLWKRSPPEWKIWTLVLILVSVVLGLYGFVRLGAFRHRSAATGPLLADLLQQQAPAAAVMEQRQDALLRDGNLWEAARELARHLFASVGTSPDAAAAPPAIAVSGGWWRRWRLRRRWRQLWRLARSARPVRVSPRGFARLAARVEALRADLTGGTVRIIP